MKILLVSSAFYPEISPRSFRATELAKEFIRNGHDVTVVSKNRDHNYDQFLQKHPVKLKMWSKAKLPEISSLKIWKKLGLSRILTRVLAMLVEYPVIEEMFRVKNMLKQERGYDLMISFAVPYPVHWGVAWAKSKNNIIADKWVADCGDPYMGNRVDSFNKFFYFGFLEKWFCRKADAITIPVKSAMPAYYKEFHPKIRIIPQGFDFDLSKYKKVTENEIPEFAYAGGFLVGVRDPKPLLDFLKTINIDFKFHIYTNQPELLNEYVLDLGEKLHVNTFIPRDELMEKLANMDFLINYDHGGVLNVPSKLIDYAILNKPVLNVEKSLNIDNILSFLNKDYSGRLQLPPAEQYHIKSVAQKFLKI